MNDQQQELTNLMTVAMGVAMVNNMGSLLRALTESELEKRLGRPLTNWDRQVYLQEKAKKEQTTKTLGTPQTPWEIFMAPFQQLIVDRQIVCNFVWEVGSDKLW